MNVCAQCKNVLTDEEHYYYEYRCESCEQAWSDRITKWRKGGEDEELDKMFSEPRRYSVH